MMRRCAVTALLLVAVAVPAVAGAAQDKPEVRVSSLTFLGNETFDDGVLRRVVQTRKASRWPWADWLPFDQRRLDADLSRLTAFYVDEGFPDARVRLEDMTGSADGRSVALRIRIDEGAPLLVEQVVIEGLDGLPEGVTAPAQRLPIRAGQRRSTPALNATRDYIVGLLREVGFPYARVDIEEQPGTAGQVALVVRAIPGPETRFGALTAVGLDGLKAVVINRAVTFRAGDLYRQSEVTRSQRRLANLQAFEFVNLVSNTEAREAKAPELPMTVIVTEAPRHRFELGVGYGTEDKVRGTFEWRDLNFFGNGSQLLFNAKFSTVLRGAGFGYEHPYLLPTGGSLSANAGAWWTNESTFESRSVGGRLSVWHELGRGRRIGEGISGWDARATYRNERLTYSVKDEALRDLGSVDERIALGLDPVTGRGDGTVAGLALDVTRRALDVPTDPTRGATLAIHLAHVAPWLAGTFRFDEVRAEVRGYFPVYRRVRVAAKVRGGTLAAVDGTTIPFSERYFLGGASSVRGWGRFQISPRSSDGLPVGGRTLLEASTELRFPVWDTFGGVVFLDAGSVWRDAWSVDLDDVRYAAGGGLRWTSLIGIVRADVGYQLNPVSELRVSGKQVTGRWRLHLSIGHAF